MQQIIYKYLIYRYIKNSFDPNSKFVDICHLVTPPLNSGASVVGTCYIVLLYCSIVINDHLRFSGVHLSVFKRILC